MSPDPRERNDLACGAGIMTGKNMHCPHCGQEGVVTLKTEDF